MLSNGLGLGLGLGLDIEDKQVQMKIHRILDIFRMTVRTCNATGDFQRLVFYFIHIHPIIRIHRINHVHRIIHLSIRGAQTKLGKNLISSIQGMNMQ